MFSHGSFPEVGQKQKTEKKEKRKRPKVGDNNGQATHGARKHAWRTQAAWAKKNLGNNFFKQKKTDFRAFFLYGQHSVAEPGPTPTPWSISNNKEQGLFFCY